MQGVAKCFCLQISPGTSLFQMGALGVKAKAVCHIYKRLFSSSSPRFYENVRVRFAPSPTGMMHLGGLRTALYNYVFSKQNGGSFILRIEDTDQARFVPGATENLMEALNWAGITPDEGPGVGGDYGPYKQSERTQLYLEHTDTLLESGHAYRCFCSSRRLDLVRKEAARRRENIKYDNRCRSLTPDEVQEKLDARDSYTVRFKLQAEQVPWRDLVFGDVSADVADVEGDPILLKSDGFPTYHLANVVDDHLMEISHVLRGWEWQVSTVKHLQLFRALGWSPPQYAHLPLLLNSDGTKLSKRQQDITVDYFKDRGYYPAAVLNAVTFTGGGFTRPRDGTLHLQHLVESFDINLLLTNSAKLEAERFKNFNQSQLQMRLNDSHLRDQVMGELKSGLESTFSFRGDDRDLLLESEHLEKVLDWAKDRVFLLNELWSSEDFRFLWEAPDPAVIRHLAADQQLLEALAETAAFLIHRHAIASGDLGMRLKMVSKVFGVPWPTLARSLRLVLTGLKSGPPVGEIVELVGPQECGERLYSALRCSADHS